MKTPNVINKELWERLLSAVDQAKSLTSLDRTNVEKAVRDLAEDMARSVASAKGITVALGASATEIMKAAKAAQPAAAIVEVQKADPLAVDPFSLANRQRVEMGKGDPNSKDPFSRAGRTRIV